jgi:hypothetical protein
VDELDDLSKNGFEVEYEGQKEFYYCHLMFVANDLMALPRVLGCPFPAHEENGCTACNVKGVNSSMSKYPGGIPVKPDAVRHFDIKDKDRKCAYPFKGKTITRGQLVDEYVAAFSKKKHDMNEYILSLKGQAPPVAKTHEWYTNEAAKTEAEIKRLHIAAGGGANKITYPDNKSTYPITCPCAFGRLEDFDVARDNIICSMHWGAHLGGAYTLLVFCFSLH